MAEAPELHRRLSLDAPSRSEIRQLVRGLAISAAPAWTFAANLDFLFTEHAFADRFAAAAEAGFSHVECTFPYRVGADVVAEKLRTSGLSMALINAYPGDWAAGDRGFAALVARQAEFEDSLGRTADYLLASRAPRTHLLAGAASRPDAMDPATYVGAVRRAADRFAQLGVEVLLEPINPHDMPNYFLNDFDLAAEVIDQVGRENVRLQFDAYHCQRIHGAVLARLTDAIGRIGHIQVASAPDRAEPDHGELDYGAFFERLTALGYAGVVGCEYHPRNGTRRGIGWLETFRTRFKTAS